MLEKSSYIRKGWFYYNIIHVANIVRIIDIAIASNTWVLVMYTLVLDNRGMKAS